MNQANQFFKLSAINSIIILAEKIRGRESVNNLKQYEFHEMIKHNLEELESIRDAHINAYNDKLKKLGQEYIGETCRNGKTWDRCTCC